MKFPDSESDPKFNVGDEVWIISHKEPKDVRVLSISFELTEKGSGSGHRPLVMIHMGYMLNRFNFDVAESLSQRFRPYEVYASREEAEELCRWNSVSGVSEEEWKSAIGDREENESLEECELSLCCANVSVVRDFLLQCKENGGLIERDVRRLRGCLGQHEYPMPNGKRPKNLDMILEKLGFFPTIASADSAS